MPLPELKLLLPPLLELWEEPPLELWLPLELELDPLSLESLLEVVIVYVSVSTWPHAEQV